MNCEEVQEQLSEYLETLLDSSAARAIDSHLAACARCAEMLAGLAQCRRLVAALPQVEPPLGFVARVMAQVNESASQSPWWQRWLLPLRHQCTAASYGCGASRRVIGVSAAKRAVAKAGFAKHRPLSIRR